MSPLARAVQVAFAASLALTGSGVALAGTPSVAPCQAYATQAAACSALIHANAQTPVVDLTTVTDAAPIAALAINQTGAGDISIVNATPIAESGTYGATAITGYSTGGNVDIRNQAGGDLTVSSTYGNAIGIYGYATVGDVSIDNAADINVDSTYGLADGIFASGKDVDVTNGGGITATGYAWAAGIEAQGTDRTTVTNSGDITATATGLSAGYYGHAFGIYSSGTNGVDLTNSGSITADGVYANGIFTQSGGPITIDNAGDITVGGNRALTSYYATGIHAASNYDNSIITIGNSGVVSAYGYFGASGIEAVATGTGGTVSVTNSGAIYAIGTSGNATSTGILASADGDASIQNSGNVYSSAGDGVLALAFNGTASVTNSGDIYALGAGIVSSSLNGAATANNSGTVESTSLGIQVSGGTGASVTNSGSVTVGGAVGGYSSKYATGIQAQAGAGDVAVNNSGALTVEGKYAYGITAIATQGDVSVTNLADGAIAINAGKYAQGYPMPLGVGVFAATTQGDVSVDNAGSISAMSGATGYYGGGGQSFGVFARSRDGNVAVTNSGKIDAVAYGNAQGIHAAATGGNVVVDNSGAITATSTIGLMDANGNLVGNAIGIYAYSPDADVSVNNDSAVTATSTYGLADGIFASGVNVDVTTGAGSSIAANGFNWAAGVEAQSYDLTTVTNGGDITATATANDGATSVYGHAYGIFASGINGVDVNNSGAITADGAYANGIFTQAGGPITITNTGDITVGTHNPDPSTFAYSSYYATGIHAANNYDNSAIVVGNSGDISVFGALGSSGIEAAATGAGSTVSVTNSGNIAMTGYQSQYGILASGDGDTSIANSGSISSLYGSGAVALAFNGTASVTNSGDISTYGFGITASSQNGAGYVNNSGTVAANNPSQSVGIYVNGGNGAMVVSTGSVTAGTVTDAGKYSYGIFSHAASGDSLVNNSGAVAVEGGKYGYGIVATATQGDVLLTNAEGGSVVVNAGKYADYQAGGGALALQGTGIVGVTSLGDVSIDNAGSVSVDSLRAYGLIGQSRAGNVSVVNSGAVDVYGPVRVQGMVVQAIGGDATVDNSGAITAMATGNDSFPDNSNAFGVVAYASGGGIDVSNSGTITATADTDSIDPNTGNVLLVGSAIGISAMSPDGDINVSNAGTITATSNSGEATATDYYGAAVVAGNAIGIYGYAGAGDISIGNDGAISTTSTYGLADGIFALGVNVDVASAGSITTVGYTSAVGINAQGATVAVNNSGSIDASAYANAIGILAMGDASASVTNSGSINATNLYGDGSQALGIYAASTGGTVAVTNAGDVYAQASTGQLAFGVAALGYGDVLIDNAGNISAGGDGAAAAVLLDSTTGISTLHNTGVISAPVAVLGLDGIQSLQNYGRLLGAIVTNGGDDVLDNHDGGVWGIGNQATDFGDGDDAIHNLAGGMIVMNNAAIHLGASGTAGNVFDNAGVLGISGANLIDMGTGITLVPSLNALPLVNDGVISFLDGATDDSLAITGDFGGTGMLDLDVDFASTSSDQLFIDGSMATGAVQTVNVVVNTLPLQGLTNIPFAQVTGNSSAGSFAGGQVLGLGANGFLDFNVGVTSVLDASNATADVFSLGLDVAGLSDAGTLAASIASGAQSLVNSQIGTYRQRMGVMPARDPARSGISPWIRAYSDNGDVDPSHVADNFSQGGDFAFSQSNHGYELGMDVNVTGPLHVGVLFNRGEGNQRLHSDGGMDHISARTFGVYGTWLASNFYVDASYRWMGFDADLRSSLGAQRLRDGGAESANVEAGWNAWTSGNGLQLTPQVQYTRTRVSDMPVLHDALADFDPRGGVSERGRVGVALSDTFMGGNWTWTPYGSVNAVREFDGQMDYVVGDRFTGSTSTEGTSALLELGIGAQRGGFAATAGVNWSDGGALDSFLGGQLVLRYTW